MTWDRLNQKIRVVPEVGYVVSWGRWRPFDDAKMASVVQSHVVNQATPELYAHGAGLRTLWWSLSLSLS